MNQLVISTGEIEGVKPYGVPPPIIFGTGTGLYSTSNSDVDSYVEPSTRVPLHKPL